MQHVLALDAQQRPLAHCRPARARLLLTQRKAAVVRRYPFTIRLKQALPAASSPLLRLKLDPGSKTTGFAVVNDVTGQVVFAASNRVSNLTLACHPCNTAKGAQTAAEFGHPKVQAQASAPLKDAAAVNTARWAFYHRLKAGVYVGRLAVRATGSCNLKTATGTIQGIHVRYCQPLQRGDGYAYAKGGAALLPHA